MEIRRKGRRLITDLYALGWANKVNSHHAALMNALEDLIEAELDWRVNTCYKNENERCLRDALRFAIHREKERVRGSNANSGDTLPDAVRNLGLWRRLGGRGG